MFRRCGGIVSTLTVYSALLVVLLSVLPLTAQTGSTTGVPRIVKFTGSIPGATGTVGVTFALYDEQTASAPVWSEVQNVSLDKNGRYTVFLGSTLPDGLPPELFTGGQTRWLGVRPEGQPELARVLLVSVPYALESGDAQTLGGRPLSSFVLAGETTGVGNDGLNYLNTSRFAKSAVRPEVTSGVPGYLGMFVDSTDLGDSVAYQSSTGSIGIGTTNPGSPLDVTTSSLLSQLHFGATGAGGYLASGDPTQFDISGGAYRNASGSWIATAAQASQIGSWQGGMYFFADSGLTAGQSFSPTVRMFMNPSGSLGIGTTSPGQSGQMLTVAGTVQSTSGGFQFPNGWVQQGAAAGVVCAESEPSFTTNGIIQAIWACPIAANSVNAFVRAYISIGNPTSTVVTYDVYLDPSGTSLGITCGASWQASGNVAIIALWTKQGTNTGAYMLTPPPSSSSAGECDSSSFFNWGDEQFVYVLVTAPNGTVLSGDQLIVEAY